MPISNDESQQIKIWELLYQRTSETLRSFGSEGIRRTADFWIDDDNIGTRQHKVYVRNLNMLKPVVVETLRSLLETFPDWEFVVAVSIPESGNAWPDMGLTIRRHEVVDGLQRRYFPKEFQSLRYRSSRPGTERD